MTHMPHAPRRCHRRHRELLRFLAAWLRTLLRTGAVAPSSAALARTMALAAAVRPGAQVVELGPGTGPVTKALIGAGVHERDLVLIETNPRFVDLLRQRFPAATVLEEDAFAAIARFAEAGMTLTAIVSSLPLMVFPRRRRRRLAMDALRALGPHGRLVQFTYGPVSPIPLDPALIAEPSRHIWNNLPPAVAWTYQHAFGYNDPQVRAEHP